MSYKTESNAILDSVLNYEYPEWAIEQGLDKIVAQGDHSHKCPVYVKRVPPCTNECPAGEDIRGYHNILRDIDKTPEGQDKWERAWRLIVDKNPFPAIMGRVCPAPCEGGCNRQFVDETVGINSVEHALGEYALKNNLKLDPPGKDSGKHVAIIGAGPAGLSAAYQLRRKGHKVTIYEAQKKTGGMIRYGIMGYRVDRKILDAEVQRILDLGVELKTGVFIGKDIALEELEKKYDGVIVAVGAQKGKMPPIKGLEGSTAMSAVKFLMDYEADPAGMAYLKGKKVAVLGDGDVAMDIVRLALRLGSEAMILSAVERNDMNCSDYEFEEAQKEGTGMHFSVSVSEVIKEGDRIKTLQCVKMQKKEKGEEGYNSPIPFLRYKPQAGSAFEMKADVVVASIGQATDFTGLESLSQNAPFFPVDHNFKVKGKENVFAIGDAVKIDLITTSVGHGATAAHAMDLYLTGHDLPVKHRNDVVRFEKMHPYYYAKSPRLLRKHRQITAVENNFAEILQPLDAEQATAESSRCMSCGLCFSCKQCLLYCPQEAIEFNRNNPIGETMFTQYKKCVGCHICSEVCPCGYIDMGMGDL